MAPKKQTNENSAKPSVKTGGTNVSANVQRRTPRSGTATPTKY